MVLLDTEPMTVLERESPEVDLLKAKLATIPLDDISTTIISYEEQTRGWLFQNGEEPAIRGDGKTRQVFAVQGRALLMDHQPGGATVAIRRCGSQCRSHEEAMIR